MFDIPEILENILGKLDTQSLFDVRPVSKMWSKEATKMLLGRDDRQEVLAFYPENVETDFKKLEALLEESENPSLLIGGISCLKLNTFWLPNTHLDFQRVIKTYGCYITSLDVAITDNFAAERLASLLMQTQCIESLSLFFYFVREPKPKTVFKCPFKLQNLHSFYLKNPEFSESLKTVVEIYKEIIKASVNMQCLRIKSLDCDKFLKPIWEDEEVGSRLTGLKTFTVEDLLERHFYPEKNLQIYEEILNVLPTFANSIESLGFFDNAGLGYSITNFPKMPKLKTIVLSSNTTYPDCIQGLATCKNFPRLKNLLLDYDESSCSLRWPLASSKNVGKLVWDNDDAGYRVDVEAMREKVVPKGHKPIKVTIGCWPKLAELPGRGIPWVDTIFTELVQMNVEYLYLNLYSEWNRDVKRALIRKCLQGLPSVSKFAVERRERTLCEGVLATL